MPPPPWTYPLSLHDALPIYRARRFDLTTGLIASPHVVAADDEFRVAVHDEIGIMACEYELATRNSSRSEEHTSELQSPMYLVCRLLLEKKKSRKRYIFGL